MGTRWGSGALVMAAAACVAAGCGEAPESTSVAGASQITTTAPASTTSTSTTSTTPAPTGADCLALAPLQAVVGQIVLATVPEERLADAVPYVESGLLGGVVVVEDTSAQIAEELAPLADVEPAPVVAVDEEGGDVQRLAAVLGEQPSARELAEADDVAATFATGADRASGAAELGFTMILAPVLDIGGSAGSDSRAYGDDPAVVVRHGLAYADGIESSGLVAVAKHFPGHGHADADSHYELPTTPPLGELRDLDLVPFETAASELRVVMTAHLDVPGLTDGTPATLSVATLDLLRGELGFDGVVLTDDLSMDALDAWSVPEAAEIAVDVGHDLLIAGDIEEAVASADRLAAAVIDGRIEQSRIDDAVTRVLGLKGLGPCDVWSAEPVP